MEKIPVSGTHTGTHPRMPEPTGRSFSVEQVWIFTVTARKISDRLPMFAQQG